MKTRRWLWILGLIMLTTNVIASAFSRGQYLIDYRGFRFPAHNTHKPLLLLNGVIVLYLLFAAGSSRTAIASSRRHMPVARAPSIRFLSLLSSLVVLAYLPTLTVNLAHHDWTHRHIAASLTSWAAVSRLFTVPQPDGMYRPLTFLSFWLDYQLFGNALWGYHLQSIGLHLTNSILVAALGARLGLSTATSRIAAVLFGVSATHFEAVLWPAARFDLLAVTFSLLSILLFLAHWKACDRRMRLLYGVLSLLSYSVAVLNKETAYSLVLITPALVLAYPALLQPGVVRSKTAIPFLVALAVLTIVLVGLSFEVFGNIGGYGYATSQPNSSTVSVKAFYYLIINTVPLSVFGINSTVKSEAATVMTTAYALWVLAWAWLYRDSRGSALGILATLALLSAVPVITVIGWIQPSLQHTRHLYWPSVWIALLLGLAFQWTSGGLYLAGLLVTLNIAGLGYNIWIYNNLLNRADLSVETAQRVVASGKIPVAEIRLVEVPGDVNGAFYFRSELEQRFAQKFPTIVVRNCPKPESCAPAPGETVISFLWNAELRMVKLIP